MRLKLFFVASSFAVAAAFAQSSDITFSNTIKIEPGDTPEQLVAKAAHVVPNQRQLAALDNGFIAFVHWGPNTFNRREWGTGTEDVKVFNPSGIDTDQWVREMQAAGMKMVLFTAKHHDGYVLWQSRYTDHGIMGSDFMGGKGDVMRDLANSCRKYGMKLGVYLSPADLYQIENPDGLYGNGSKASLRTIPRAVEGRPFANTTTFEFEVDDYNEYFLNQLFELLTEYGPIHEVWFDGAHPKRKGGQTYNYPAWKKLIHTLAPEAVIFGREDMRWCGNEAGLTRDTEWNVVPYAANPDTLSQFHDMRADDLGSRNAIADARYLHYQPAETDVSIRDGWFYRDDERQRVRSADEVFDMYERSTGGNAVLLLNIPPNREGRFADRDVAVLREVGKRIGDTYGTNLLDGAVISQPDAAGSIEISLAKPVTINRFMLAEPVAKSGERIEEHALDAMVDGAWREIAKATNVGFKRILRFPDVTTDRLRVRVLASRLAPEIASVAAYRYAAHAPELGSSRSLDGMVTIEPKGSYKGVNAAANLCDGYVIYYTTDGSEPTSSSTVYTSPFHADNVTVKAISVLGESVSPVMEQLFGYVKNDWSAPDDASKAIDADPSTYWRGNEIPGATLTVDLGAGKTLRGFAYTPQTEINGEGMIAVGEIEVSADGKKWTKAADFEFGNLINEPTTRYHYFSKPIEARFVRLKPLELAGEGKFAAVAELDFF